MFEEDYCCKQEVPEIPTQIPKHSVMHCHYNYIGGAAPSPAHNRLSVLRVLDGKSFEMGQKWKEACHATVYHRKAKVFGGRKRCFSLHVPHM